MSIKWYYNRLKSMSSAEVIWRVQKIFWKKYAKIKCDKWNNRLIRKYTDPSSFKDSLESVKFFGVNERAIEYFPKEWKKRAIYEADNLMQHKYGCFAIENIDLGKEIQWNKELKSNLELPLEFGLSINYRDKDTWGDFKYFWELGRFQHLVILAKAYFVTKNESYCNEIILQLKSFIKQCPYLKGVNWIMPMEAGIRLISICWIVHFIKDRIMADAELCRLFSYYFHTHIHFTTNNYARFSSANNHLVGEAAGVYVAALTMKNVPEIAKHKDHAKAILCDEIIAQHFDDGVNREQGVHYQMFAFYLFLLPAVLGSLNNDRFPEEYWQMLFKSARFLNAISSRDGRWAMFGDSDDGIVHVITTPDRKNEMRSLLQLANYIFDSDFHNSGNYEKMDESNFWLISQFDAQFFINKQSFDASKKNDYPEGGYYILNADSENTFELIVDCGPIGFKSIAAHGHADALSFVLKAGDSYMIIDPGTYTYVANNPARDYFRSTYAHNTITVDNQNQSEILGPFLWGKKANCMVSNWQTNHNGDTICIKHDGYNTLTDPVIHERTIQTDKNSKTIEIQDQLLCNHRHEISLNFHFDENCDVNIQKNIVHICKNNSKIEMKLDDTLTWRLIEASDRSMTGWVSYKYDELEKAISLVGFKQINGNTQIITKIRKSL